MGNENKQNSHNKNKNSTKNERTSKNMAEEEVRKTNENDINNDKKRWLKLKTYIEWFKSRLKLFLLASLVITSVVFAVFICIVVWTFVNHNMQLNEQTLLAHKPNQMDLYKESDFQVPIPKDDNISDADTDDVDTYNDLAEPSDMDPDKPTFSKSGKDGINLETDDDIVSHNEILHEDAFNEMPIHNKQIKQDKDILIPLAKHKGFLEELRKEHSAMSDRMESNKYKKKLSTTPIKLATDPIELITPSMRPTKPTYGIVETDIINSNTAEKNHFLAKAMEIASIVNKKEFKESPPGNPHPTRKSNPVKKTPTVENAETRHSSTSSSTSDSSDTPAMTLYRVDNAVKAGAVCLDGSPPAYYHRPGTGNSEKLWIIHFNGGAWCFDVRACIERSHSSLGSTKKLPPAPPIIQGINSPDPSINPDFYDWNLVWVVYCDGASFTGNREKPIISDKGETIYMRGKRVLNAIINDLLFNRDFKYAEAIILTGSSAGSMTAIFQADYIASKFPRTVPVRVLSDAGFFIDTSSIGGKNLGIMFKQIYVMQNSSAGLDQDCVGEIGLDKAWECFFPSRTAKYVRTPIFVLNAAYDIWALIYFLNIDCKFPTVNKDNRKKRSIIQKVHSRSDSELDLPLDAKEKVLFDEGMIKRKRRDIENSDMETQVSIVKGVIRKRDVSGFEIKPFFRQVISNRGTIPLSLNRTTNIQHQRHIIRNNSSISSKTKTPITRSQLQDIFQITNFTNIFSLPSSKNMTNKPIPANPQRSSITKFTGLMHKMNHSKIPFQFKLPKPSKKVILPKMYFKVKKNLTGHYISQKNNKTILNHFNTIHSKRNSSENLKHSSKFLPAKILRNFSLVKNLTHHNLPAKISQSVRQYYSPKERYENYLESKFQASKLKYIDKLHNNIKTSAKLITVKGIKRQIVNQTIHNKNKDKTKWRRSTSIAKEYINILRSDPPECTAKELINAMKYRNAIIHATNALSHLPKSGRFLVSCIDHSLSLFDETWTSLVVDGKSIQQAFGDWFYERGNKDKYDTVDCPYPCNPTCP